MDTRVNLSKSDPAAYAALLAMNKAASEAAQAADLDPKLCELIKIRASQLNGCSYCLRMHTRDALKLGESSDRLAVLPAWRESEYFSAVERAALALSESITLVSVDQVPRDTYTMAASVLTDAQVSAVAWLSAAINMFNRVAITSRYPVTP
ncbi:carboxymuconolactone decarboxylase family protein [Paeniglutamicibacter sp. NPDC012692]|uniref:carboxymuconolactone decarboxylase family protein n=1 Tax=Paeniglutamicibacter sp. NPDC012692 TaxID=3364388 RepID=UPI0036B7EA82